jgi:CMP-N-acetylneuraminic acid synthetase
MNILVVIPARKGSKRVPGKNMRLLGGRPLISWTFDIAKKINRVCNVLVTTDDSLVMELAIKEGLMAPWLRPESLSTDMASSVDVTLHAISWYESEYKKVDGVLLLQPTSPFRTLESINLGIELYSMTPGVPVIGVSKVKHGVDSLFASDDRSNLAESFSDKVEATESIFEVNGGFYLVSPEQLRERRNFLADRINLLKMPFNESLDIDTMFDFLIAEAMVLTSAK